MECEIKEQEQNKDAYKHLQKKHKVRFQNSLCRKEGK